MQYKFKLYFLLHILLLCRSTSSKIKIKKRALLFPATSPTRTQFIGGIGIPLELDQESLTTGYVLKAEYFLPTKAEEFHPDKIRPQQIGYIPSKRSINENRTQFYDLATSTIESYINESNDKLSKYRWALYKVFETIINRLGYVGRTCVLLAICEAAESPLHYQSGIIGQIINLIMSPSSSVDKITRHSDNEYLHAEVLGKTGAPCHQIFKECKKSFLGRFTSVFEFGDTMINNMFF